MDDLDVTHVRIDTEAEVFPALSIVEIGNPKPDEGLAIPTELWRNLRETQAAVDRAEMAVMRYVAEHYPQAKAMREWVADYGDEETDG